MNSAEMLQEAAKLVGGERAKDYGDKRRNHQNIADLWNLWLSRRHGSKQQSLISAYDVAMMMLLLKVARLMNSPGHADSHIDVAGYASILEEITRPMVGGQPVFVQAIPPKESAF